jgi:hypothetical protein
MRKIKVVFTKETDEKLQGVLKKLHECYEQLYEISRRLPKNPRDGGSAGFIGDWFELEVEDDKT